MVGQAVFCNVVSTKLADLHPAHGIVIGFCSALVIMAVLAVGGCSP